MKIFKVVLLVTITGTSQPLTLIVAADNEKDALVRAASYAAHAGNDGQTIDATDFLSRMALDMLSVEDVTEVV